MKYIFLILSLFLIGVSAQAQHKLSKSEKRALRTENKIRLNKQDYALDSIPEVEVLVSGKKFKHEKTKIFKNKKNHLIFIDSKGVHGDGFEEDTTKPKFVVPKETDVIPLSPSYIQFGGSGSIQNETNLRTLQEPVLNSRQPRILVIVGFDLQKAQGWVKNPQLGIDYVNVLHAQANVQYNAGLINLKLNRIIFLDSLSAINLTQYNRETIDAVGLVYGNQPEELVVYLGAKTWLGGEASAIGGVLDGKGFKVCVSNQNGDLRILNNDNPNIGQYAHEIGHLMGMQHSHDCGFVLPSGRLGKLDSCYKGQQAVYNFDCDKADGTNATVYPKGGGTIMSYCHLAGLRKLRFHPSNIEQAIFTLNQTKIVSTAPKAIGFNLSSWSSCYWGFQTRKILSTIPAYTEGVATGVLFPELVRTCTIPCTSWVQTWYACDPNDCWQYSSVPKGLPVGCNTPFTGVMDRRCPDCVTPCTTCEYGPWTPCSGGIQTREVINRVPTLCYPCSRQVRTCTGNPPQCTYTYSPWSTCLNGTQTRTVTSSSPSGCVGTPVLSQSCTITPPTTTNTFSISGSPYTGYSRKDTSNAVDGNETTRFLTNGATTLTWTFAVPTTRTSVYLSSGFNGGSFNTSLILTVDGVNVPLGYTPRAKFTKAINVTGKQFRLTTTGVSNISRIFEVSLK
jgi:hypothetical protein